MKIDKQLQKKCILQIRESAINNGYKKIQNTIYKVDSENIISIDFLIVNSEYLNYRINIKKQSFDKIFWQIMRMEENIKKGNVLKVNGAFAAPTILVGKGKIELSESIDIIVNVFFERIYMEVKEFLEENNVVQYIFSGVDMIDRDILQCLSYIDLNLLSKAEELAKKQILLGEKGRFVNEGKGFFELVLLYNK